MLRRTPLRSYTSLKRTGFKAKKRKPLRKKSPASRLKRKLWAIVSQVIRRKYADENGMVKCVSCPAVKPWREMQCGHYVPASAGMATYFEETNLHPQDASCNIFRGGNLTQYTLFMIEKYGVEKLAELEAMRRTTRKISREGYEELIEVWEAKLAALDAAQKGSEAA